MARAEPRPILAASAVVFRGRDVLLVQRGRPPGQGLWSLPGGNVLFGETLQAAALREVREETGVAAEIKGFAGNYEIITGEQHFVIACYGAVWQSGEALAASDAAAACFVDLADFGNYELALNTAPAIAAARVILGI